MSVAVRQATPADGAGIADLMGQLGYPTAQEEMEGRVLALSASEADRVFVAEDEGRILGVLSAHMIPVFHEPGSVGRITALVVSADHRRQGIGALLMRHAEAWAWKHDCRRIEVTSAGHRAGAHRFYEGHGYKTAGRRFVKNRSGPGLTA